MDALKEWAKDLIHAYGLGGLFGIAFMESSFFPIPPDVFMMGLLLTPNPPSPFLTALICTIGSVLGAALGWAIGAYGGYPLLHRFFKEEKVQAVERLYQRYGVFAILMAAFTPIPYKVFTIASGVFRYNLLAMLAVSVVGRGARFFLVAYLVQWFGESILKQFDRVVLVGTVLLIAGVAGYLYWRSRHGKIRLRGQREITAEKD